MTPDVTDVTGVHTKERFGAAAHALLRVGAGLLFMQHGAQKLLGAFGGFGGTPGATADVFSLMGVAGALELFGGLMIVVGLLARPVALVLAGQMAVAWFIAHAPNGWVPIQNGGELALLFMLTWLYIAARGAGPLSLDAMWARSRETRALQRRPQPVHGTGQRSERRRDVA